MTKLTNVSDRREPNSASKSRFSADALLLTSQSPVLRGTPPDLRAAREADRSTMKLMILAPGFGQNPQQASMLAQVRRLGQGIFHRLAPDGW